MPFKDVIICEKVNQALIFAKIFKLSQKKSFHGFDAVFYDSLDGIAVVSQSGHLLQQAPPEHYQPKLKSAGWDVDLLPIIPQKWKIEVKRDSRGGRIQDRINGLLAGIKFALVENGKPHSISIAVDNDKEGELLGWEVLDYFNLMDHPNIHRLLYSQMSEENMLEAYKNKVPGKVWFPRYLAGLARARCDWLIGMTVTMALTDINKNMLPRRTAMNAGRVIFAMVYILYLRHQEVISYVKTDYFTINAKFSKPIEPDFEFKASMQLLDEWLEDAPGDKRYLLNATRAEQVAKQASEEGNYTVTEYSAKPMEKEPPLGFARTPFDSWMVKHHNLALSEISEALQVLYSDKGLISYPRVEVDKLDTEMHPKMPSYIESIRSNIASCMNISEANRARYEKIFNALDLSIKSSFFEDGINTGESHHAIIPTAGKEKLDSLTPTQLLVYIELVDRLLMQFLPNYQYKATSVKFSSGKFAFSASGTTPIRMGWKSIYKEDDSDEKEEVIKIPLLEVGDKLDFKSFEIKQNTTKKPQYYRVNELLEAMLSPKKFVKNPELVKRLKTLQIGTGNTRSVHVGELQAKGLSIEKAEGTGKKIVRLIPTKKMIALAEIAPEYFKYPEMSAFWEDSFNKIQSGEIGFDDFMKRQEGLIHRFIADCRNGKYKMINPIYDFVPCRSGECKGKVFRAISKDNKYYWACNLCDAAYADDDGKCGKMFGGRPPEDAPKLPCPSCKKNVFQVERESQSSGKKYKCWVCPDCKSSYFDSNGGIGQPFGKPPAKKTSNGQKSGQKASAT